MDTGAIYNLSDELSIRSSYEIPVVSKSSVKTVSKCCQVLLCSLFV